MTVALVLATQPDAGLRGQLTALGVRRVAAAERTGPGLLTVAAAARAAGERVLICVGDDSVPEEVLTRLLAAGGTAAFTGRPAPGAAGPPDDPGAHRAGALIVDTPDLDALASSAEALAARRATPAEVSTLLGELTQRGVGVRVLDAGPDGDGAVARLIADPMARDMACWAAGRQLAPVAMYGISLGLGLLAAVWFSEPATRTQVLAIVALLFSFVSARTAAQLGAIEGIRPAAGWLGVASALITEFAVYAALAVSSGVAAQNAAQNAAPGAVHGAAQNAVGSIAGPAGLNGIFGGSMHDAVVAGWLGADQIGVWRLAVAAMLLLGARRLAELCYEGLARASGSIFPRPARRLLGQVIVLPAGERIAVIAVTVVFFGPRLTFLVLLAWGAVGAGYLLAGQLAGAGRLAAAGQLARARGVLVAYRGDGPLAHRIGGVVRGQLPPLPPLLVGLLVTCDLAILGVANLPGVLILAPVAAMLLAALGSRHPHDGRLDWTVPSLLLVGEGVFLAGLGFARHVWLPVIFALLAAVVLRHADLACRARAGRGIPADKFGLGWDGRMLVAGLAAVFGFVPFAFAVLAAWLWLLTAWDFLGAWLQAAGQNLDRHAAAHGQRGPGDERTLVAGQERHGRLPGPGPGKRRRRPVQGVRYIGCGVAVLANSRQRRGPGAPRRRSPRRGGNRLLPCPGCGWPPGWPAAPCSAAGSRCSAGTPCTGCGAPAPPSPTHWPRSPSWPGGPARPPGSTSRSASWSAGPSWSRCCGWCGPATVSPRSGWWPIRPPR